MQIQCGRKTGNLKRINTSTNLFVFFSEQKFKGRQIIDLNLILLKSPGDHCRNFLIAIMNFEEYELKNISRRV